MLSSSADATERVIDFFAIATESHDPDAGQAVPPDATTVNNLAKIDINYLLLMMTAGSVAAVGLTGDLPMAIVGAMAFSPDLGRLNFLTVLLYQPPTELVR